MAIYWPGRHAVNIAIKTLPLRYCQLMPLMLMPLYITAAEITHIDDLFDGD